MPNYDAVRNHLASSHSAPEHVGAIAERAGVGTLVLSHLVPGDGEIPEDEWEARARRRVRRRGRCAASISTSWRSGSQSQRT